MYIDPKQMDDAQLIQEIEAAKEELDLFSGISAFKPEKMPFDPRVSVQEISDRLDQLIFEGSKRGLCRPNFRQI